jgi:hypothetical protein
VQMGTTIDITNDISSSFLLTFYLKTKHLYEK